MSNVSPCDIISYTTITSCVRLFGWLPNRPILREERETKRLVPMKPTNTPGHPCRIDVRVETAADILSQLWPRTGRQYLEIGVSFADNEVKG